MLADDVEDPVLLRVVDAPPDEPPHGLGRGEVFSEPRCGLLAVGSGLAVFPNKKRCYE